MPVSKKPIVYYTTLDTGLFPIEVGARANVRAYGHPNFHEGKWVHTSRVLSVKKNGTFETLNTIYKPKKD